MQDDVEEEACCPRDHEDERVGWNDVLVTSVTKGLNALDQDGEEEGSEEDEIEQRSQDLDPDPAERVLDRDGILQPVTDDQQDEGEQGEQVVIGVQEEDQGSRHLGQQELGSRDQREGTDEGINLDQS